MPQNPIEQPPESNYVAYDFVPWWQNPTIRRVLALLAVLVVGMAIASLPAWRAFKKFRAQRYAGESRQLLAEGQLAEAYDRARLGLQLQPDEPELLRLIARILGTSGATSGLDAWKDVLSHPWATLDDRHAYTELALALDQPQLVRPELESLLSVSNPAPQTLYLATRFRLRLNDLPGALDHARELVRLDQTNPTNLLTLATLLESRSESGATDEARRILLQLAGSDSARRLDALDALINRPAATRADREEAVRILESLPVDHVPEPVRTQVLLADARMQLDPSRTRTIALELLAKLRVTTDTDLLEVAHWLHRHQLFDRSLTLLTPNRVQSSLALFRARIVALLGGGQVASAYRESLRDIPSFDPLELELDRFRLASMAGDADAARVHQESLIQIAGRDRVRMRRVAEFAESTKLPELAIAAWKFLANDRLEAARAVRALAALTDAAGDTWAARDYARKLANLEPENPLLQLQIAHYDLLLGEGFERSLGTAESLMERPEFRVNARIVAAYACLLLDQRERARNHLSLLQVPGLRLPIHLRALLTALLGATGRDAEARTLADSLPLADLRPEERELIRPYLSLQP